MRLHRLKVWWALRGRLRELRRGLVTSVVEPGRAAEIAAGLEVPPELWERWLRGLKSDARWRAGRLETFSESSEEGWEEIRRGRRPPAGPPHQPKVASDAHAVSERARRQLLLLLELPMMRREPELASQVIVHLAEAVASSNPERLAALGGAIEEGYWICATGRPPTLRAGAAGFETLAMLEGRHGAPSGSEKGGEVTSRPGFQREPDSISYRAIDVLNPGLVETDEGSHLSDEIADIPGILEARRYVQERSQELSALPEGPEWAYVGKLLETLCGDPEARDSLSAELAYLDSLQERLRENPGPPASSVSLVAVVRRRLERLVMELAGRSTLDRGRIDAALYVAAQHLTSSLDELSWALEPRLRGGARAQDGQSFPEHVDVAWTLLRRVALSAMLFRRDGRVSKQTPPQISRLDLARSADYGRLESALTRQTAQGYQVLRTLGQSLYNSVVLAVTSFVVTLAELRLLRREPLEVIPLSQQSEGVHRAGPSQDPVDLGNLLRPLLSSDWARVDPELAIRLAGEISRRGTLSWQMCLELANTRTGFHRYVEAPSGARWQLMADVRPGDDGGLEIPFSVVEQPLSPRFRGLFESQHLEGRVRLLNELIAYAARRRGAILRIGTADAEHQVALREGELWQELLAIDQSLNPEQGAM